MVNLRSGASALAPRQNKIGESDGDQSLDRLITSQELERMLGVGNGWAAKDRLSKARIPFVRIGSSVRYRLADVQAFIQASIRLSTSDPGSEAA